MKNQNEYLRITGAKVELDEIEKLIQEELSEDISRELESAIDNNGITFTPAVPVRPKLGERTSFGQIEIFDITLCIAINLVSTGLYEGIKYALKKLKEKRKIESENIKEE